MEKQAYVISFDEAEAYEANRYAEELRQVLLDASPDIEVQRRRDDARTQDFGTTLVLLLGTPAMGVAITAISNWLSSRNRASITVKKGDKEVVVQNITSAKAAELAQLLLDEP